MSKTRCRRTRRVKRAKSYRKKRSQRGGQCYGRGVGANTFDPNYSIYNTNMLNLFPYRS